jgi:hypothetical protein
MLRTLGIIGALQLLTWTSAFACAQQQVGAVIFQDSFADDSGGWNQAPPNAIIQPPNFVFALDAKDGGQNVLNLTFNTTDGDFCMDFVLPAAIAANNQMYAGIDFWATSDYNNMIQINVLSNGSVDFAREAGGNWTTIMTVPNAPGFNAAANAVNTLRVTALNGTITVYLNGSQVKTMRAQEPANANSFFGMNGEDDTAVANAPKILIKSFSVTAGH